MSEYLFYLRTSIPKLLWAAATTQPTIVKMLEIGHLATIPESGHPTKGNQPNPI
jgi:hypothetical protein